MKSTCSVFNQYVLTDFSLSIQNKKSEKVAKAQDGLHHFQINFILQY